MLSTILIAILSCFCLIITVIFKPEITIKKHTISLYPFIAFIGAVLMLIFTPLTLNDCINGIISSGAVNPIKILVLFISVTAISIFLDEGGFFEYLAFKILLKANKSQTKLFLILYIVVSLLTIFTSNDIIILTFTPLIICFCRNAKINPFPYLMSEFVAANTWSMTLIIGNPTNIYLATSGGIDFFNYFKIMFIPTLFTGCVSFIVLYMLFRKSLNKQIDCKIKETSLKDKNMCILGCFMLFVCTISLAISNFIHVEMWIECVLCLCILIMLSIIICLIKHQKPIIVEKTFMRLPYALIPFVLSMFVISLSLDKVGITKNIATFFSNNELVLYGMFSFLGSNLVNNIPMSIIFSSLINISNASNGAIFASIVGSNLGAILTPIGALAGIMFSSICKNHGEKISPLKFIMYGSIVSIASLIVALFSLEIIL